MKAHVYNQNPDGTWGAMAAPGALWTYASPASGISTTTDVQLKAGEAGKSQFLESLQLVNVALLVGTEVVVKDGSTVIWRMMLPALLTGTTPCPMQYTFSEMLKSSSGNALVFACSTSGAAVYVNAQGFTK